jgi:hypothetical protein
MYDDAVNLTKVIPQAGQGGLLLSDLMNFQAGTFGRPLAMLSFTLNADIWPANPYWFKVTNLIIHILNGILIYIFLGLLCQRLGIQSHNLQVYILAVVAIWLTHPLHMSTTMYVVQRMTMLSATFCLLLLIYYLHKLASLQQTKSKTDLIIPSGVMALLGLAALLSKENALLVVPILWLLSVTLTAPSQSKSYELWRKMALILPTLIVLAGFIYYASVTWINSQLYQVRDYTPEMRLLSQGRIIFDYLGQIILPNYQAMSLFHDDFLLSSSLLTPITTLISFIGIIGILGFAYWTRSKVVKLCIAWFFIWHIFESSSLPLYPYFEHRNYLASLGPISLLIVTLHYLLEHKTELLKKFILLLVLPFMIQLGILGQKWSSEESMYLHWLENQPQSRQTFYSVLRVYEASGHMQLSNLLADQALEQSFWQYDAGLRIKKYAYQCILKSANESKPFKLIPTKPEMLEFHETLVAELRFLTTHALNRNCMLNNDEVHQFIGKIIEHAPAAKVVYWKKSILEQQGYLYLSQNNLVEAISAFKAAYSRNKPNIALPIIDLSINLGNLETASKWLLKVKADIDSQNIQSMQLLQQLQLLENKLRTQQ